jgi:hypothetical protein
MAEITLADYTGYIFLEIIKAREMADQYARHVAESYAEDPVMKHFSTPRFKIPKMELTIPVLISGARFSQAIHFKMTVEEFVAFIQGRVKDVVNSVHISTGEIFTFPRPQPPTAVPMTGRRSQAVAARSRLPVFPGGPVGEPLDPSTAAAIDKLAREFYVELVKNPVQPGNIVTVAWARIFNAALVGYGLVEVYQQYNPNNELFNKTAADVLRIVTANTIIDRTTIENLLVNPETNVVKNGSSETSVFTIRAEMVEEGFFIRTIRDEDTGEERPIVEFE